MDLTEEKMSKALEDTINVRPKSRNFKVQESQQQKKSKLNVKTLSSTKLMKMSKFRILAKHLHNAICITC